MTLGEFFTSLANAIRTKGGTSAQLYPNQMAQAIADIQPQISLQAKSKSYTPSETAQSESVGADSGYDGLQQVNVNVGAIPPSYVGSGVARKSSADLAASGATVSVPAGYYASEASKAVASGTEGTPTATKGAVSGHAVTVTPKVTNAAGYIAGGTRTGSGVTVQVSELVSGKKTITANDTDIDVTEYASVDVDVPAGGAGWEKIASTTLTVSTTSTSAASAGTISLGSTYFTEDKIIYVRIRDHEGKRAGYFYGSDAYFMNYYKSNGASTTLATPAVLVYRYNNSALAATAGQYGVYGYSINSSGVLTIRRRYNSSYSLTINSTFDVDVYAIDPPQALFG
ncbi:MAG: hypothetical protein II907_00200 [Firmicutes bacterium]|nr:hypothetical protein [Bacillota bacterium]